MANRKRSKPRAMAGKRQERPKRDNRGTMTDRPMKRLEKLAALLRDYDELLDERRYKARRQAAIKAGVDVLLCVREYPRVFENVVAAVRRGEISESRIDESVRRILKLRQAAGAEI